MSEHDHERMGTTNDDVGIAKGIVLVARYVLLPLQVVLIVLKLVSDLELSWWLVLLPGLLYVLHPVVIGVLGPVRQHLRYRARSGDGGEGPE